MSAQQTSLFPESGKPKRSKSAEPIGLKHVILFGSMKGYTIERALEVSVLSVQWYLRRMSRPVDPNIVRLINNQDFLAR